MIDAWAKRTNLGFSEHLIRSDGATSHFKSRFGVWSAVCHQAHGGMKYDSFHSYPPPHLCIVVGVAIVYAYPRYTLYYLTKYAEEFKLKRATWCFGAPGHGKGPWDGLAGMLKSWLRRRITDNELVMSTEYDVYTELLHFVSAEYKAKAEAAGRKNCSFNVQWLPEFDRVAAGSLMVDTVKAHSRGVRKLFSFSAVAKGQLASRVFSCWCPACVAGKCSVDGKQTEGCMRAEQWQTQEIRELTNVGVAAQRKQCQERA